LNKLKWYPRIIFICFSFATINRLTNFIKQDAIFILQLLHVIFSGLFGFFNALAYGLNGNIKKIIYQKLQDKGIIRKK